ncbi:MAG: putative spore protein YtfJ [Candidatus Latescibacteria bacterium ADurb.Bin168]|nr:MAG: putative spore protein YtfJ [Candidatus Latescibacteria bacterium ADurb.Bin168]
MGGCTGACVAQLEAHTRIAEKEGDLTIEALMQTLLERLRDLVRTETVIGKPIEAGGVIIIPVSRISVGFGAGGNMNTQSAAGGLKGGGGGGGVRVEPLGFVVVSDGKAEVLPMKPDEPAINKIVDMLPGIWDSVRSMLDKRDRKKE